MTTTPEPKTYCEHVLHDDEPCDSTFLLFTCRGCGLRSCNVHGDEPYCYACRTLITELEEKRMHAALLAELGRRRCPEGVSRK